jgi:manganese/zinc/iron transport system permease protein
MQALERIIIDFLLLFMDSGTLYDLLNSPRLVATLVGALVAISGALLGTFLLLRRMSLTSDAISHTILLGIVIAFMIMAALPGIEPDLSSPWLILGAAAAGVATVILTELIQKSGLVKADAALGLAFPLLFAVSIILISRYLDNTHLDVHSVTVGEIGAAWTNTHSHCYENCATVTITPESEIAEVSRDCTNCTRGGISPRDPEAIFVEECANCGTFTPGQIVAQAARGRQLVPVDQMPVLVLWPKSLTVMGVITLVNLLFVTVFYKELKLSTFDSALAKALGFRPAWISYALMILVSITAVGAFDAVGSILVIAFFIIPPATATLLTHRLSTLLILSPIIGALSAHFGYDLARGDLFSVVTVSQIVGAVNDVARAVGGIFGLTIADAGPVRWNVSISASIVMMAFLFFMLAWVGSPRGGLIATLIQRRAQRQSFADQVLLAHIYNHQNELDAADECSIRHLHEHFNWPHARTRWMLARLRALNLVRVEDEMIQLTDRGERQVREFRATQLATG